MADEITPRQGMIRRFKRRARRRRRESYLVFCIMLSLLLAAGWVFYHARAVTLNDTKVDLRQNLVTAQQNLLNDNRLSDQLISEVKQNVNDIVESIGATDTTKDRGQGRIQVQLLDDTHSVRSKGDIYKEISDQVKELHITLPVHVTLSLKGGFPMYFRILDAKALQTLGSESNWSHPQLLSLFQRFDEVSHRINIDSQAIIRLRGDITEQEINTAAGESVPAQNSGWFLIQLNINRFGTITLAVIAIGIFAPTYRYLARLAAFYTARADALQLYQGSAYTQVGFVRLITALTPNFNFGKSPSVPDHLVEMLAIAAPRSSTDSE